MSNSLQPHGLQHSRPLFPSPMPRAYSNSCPLHRLCHPTISSSVIPFSSCLQSFPASGSFPMSWFFTSGSQSRCFSLSISPSNEYSGLISFRMDWLDLLAVQGMLKSLLQHRSSKASILQLSAFCIVQLQSSDKMWSTGEGNGKPLPYSCCENPMNSMKRQKDRTLKDELPRQVGRCPICYWRAVEK